MLQGLSVNHKFFKIICQVHLKWICSILQDCKRKENGQIFPFVSYFLEPHYADFICCLFKAKGALNLL